MNNIIYLLTFYISTFLFAQTENEVIQKDFESMISYTKKNQIDKVIDMTYPPFVALFGKEGLTQLAGGMLAGMGIKTIFEENPIQLKMTTISKLKEAELRMASYDSSMILEFLDDAMVQLFTMAPIDGYLIEKLEAKKIRMKGKAYLLAIKDEHTKKLWKYLNFSDEQSNSPMATKVVSEQILSESKKLKTRL